MAVHVRPSPLSRLIGPLCVMGWFVAVASYSASVPAGWTNEDIGAPPVAGSAFYGNGKWTNFGSGSDISGTNDQFNFTYTSLTNDGDIVALVNSQTGPDPLAQAGVMMRADDTAGAAEASVLVTPGGGVLFRYRSTALGGTTQATAASINAPAWVRLSRSNNVFTAACSTDGIAWSPIGAPQSISMSGAILSGMAVTAHTNAAVLNLSVMSCVFVVSGPQIGVPAGLTNSFIHSAPFVLETTWPLPQINCASNAPTPRMGWNSWFTVGDAIGPSETLIKEVADAFITNGLLNAGYQYVVIDCSWISASGRGSRDTNGNLIPDATRWPDGMKAVADYVHSKGLLMGGYSDIGTSGYGSPAQLGLFKFYQQDADQFAAWGWDFIKIDDHGPGDFFAAATSILNNDLGRSMALSLSTPQVDGLQFASRVANSYRVANDIAGVYANVSWSGILTEFDTDQADWYAQAPGHFNDPDMLVTGMNGISSTEGRSQFNMWAISGAPLMLGMDPRTVTNGAAAFPPTITPATLSTITNLEVIAIDQDPLGAIGRPVSSNLVYAKPLGDFTSGQYAVLLLNRSGSPMAISVNWGDVGLVPGSTAVVRDLWAHQDLGSFSSNYTTPVLASHDSMMITVAGAYDWNRSRTYEAEWGYNTISGTACYVPHAGAFSATAYVTGVGSGSANALQFNKVAVPTNGLYEVDLYYACASNRTALLSVNGGLPTNINFSASGSDTQPSSTPVYLQLNAGENTLTFGNPTAPAPNFDKIEVSTGVPNGLAAVAGDGVVNLTWANQPGAASYNLYRATTSGSEGALPFFTGITTPAFADTQVTNGQTYYYTVTAVNPTLGRESSQSAEAGAEPRCATTSTAYQTAALAAGPYAYWRLNETNGPIAHDYMGLYNGTYGNAVGLGVAGPRPANFLGFELTNIAAQFTNNVSNSWISIPALNLNTNAVTITCWIYPTGTQPDFVGLLFCRSGTTVAGLNYGGSTTGNTGFLGYTWNNLSSTYGWNSGLVPPNDQWSFVALVIQNNQAVLYLKNANGQSSATNNLSHPNQAFAGNGTIGTDTFASSARIFNGLIDEMAVYKYSMSAPQIQQLYDNGAQLSQVQLGAQWSAGSLSLNWPQGTLFQAPVLTGPWSRVTNAVSPFFIPSNSPTTFFRVLLQQ
jgi:alpha-galactosidase